MLRKELPGDTEVAESLFHAQVALKTTRGEEVSNMKFGGEVEIVTSIEQVRAAMHSPGKFSVQFWFLSAFIIYSISFVRLVLRIIRTSDVLVQLPSCIAPVLCSITYQNFLHILICIQFTRWPD